MSVKNKKARKILSEVNQSLKIEEINLNTPTLKTERLILRKFTLQDLDDFMRIFKDVDANKFLPWFPIKDIAEAKNFYAERYAKIYENPRGYAYAICLKDENIPIGYINVDIESDAHDLGYGLRKEYWHKGIAAEACAAVIKQIEKDGLSYITATHDVNNPQSGHVMEKIGMQYCYSYEEMWQPKNIKVVFKMYQLNFDYSDFIYQGYWNNHSNHFVEKFVDNR